MKEELFSKLTIKNYNNQLEKVLEAKDFSKDVKNLLLSMLYKVETSYNDYAKVKRNVENKNEFIELILLNIKMCQKIKLIKPASDRAEELEKVNKTFCIDKEEKAIETFPNEKSLLYAIYYLGNEKMYLNEKYDYIRIAFPAMLNEGKDNNKVEIIRDFNAWSWNSSIDEITNLTSNLIYQDLLILLGYEELDNWMKNETYEDKIEVLEKKLNSIYGNELTNKILNSIYKISISLCSKRNDKERERLKDEYRYVKMDYNKMKNKKAFLTEMSEKKKDLLEKIGDIDNKLKDRKILEEEYIKRNNQLPEYNKLMNVEHLIQILQKERKKALRDIEEYNNIMDPKKYIEEKERLKKQFELLEYLERDTENETEQLQEVFLQAFQKKIEKTNNKKELIELVYILRYYYFIPYTNSKYIKDNKKLKSTLEEVTQNLIEKMYEYKLINKSIAKNKINNIIIGKIFETRIMNLETIEVEVVEKDEKIKANIYDKEDFEKAIEIPDLQEKIKISKKIKLFN